VCIGHSFRDDHVNELIRRWSWDEATRRIVVVDPFWPSDAGRAGRTFRDELVQHLTPPPRPSGEASFEARLEIVSESCRQALADIELAPPA
jgi:hypothetical protein